MLARAANAYRRVDLDSAPKQDILTRLFDRFLADVDAARAAIGKRDIARKSAAIDHALQIVTELEASLDHKAAPELCANLLALYQFVTQQLYAASVKLDAKPLDHVTRVMTELATSFREVQPR